MRKTSCKAVSSQRMMLLMLVLSSIATFIIILLGTIFLRYEIKELPASVTKDGKDYSAYYALVVEDTKDVFWQSVYKAAKKEGSKNNIFVEMIGDDLLKDYSVEDKFEIALASGADGIMVAPEGQDIEALLIKAAKQEVPVVTLLDDCIKGERQSFIGINNAEIAKLYQESINQMSTPIEKVLILIDAQDQLNSKNLMCLSISELLSKQGISVEVKPINRANTFSAEEIIRDIILNVRKIPDVLICLNTEDTICAYQAVIDYNKVGSVAIMGYYQSDTLLQGIEKGIIYNTLLVDSEQMGSQGVEALNSYRTDQQVNAYFTVGVKVIDQNNVAEYIRSNEKGE